MFHATLRGLLPYEIILLCRRDCDKIEKARSYREAMKRVVVSAESPPSICFYTLLNTQQG